MAGRTSANIGWRRERSMQTQLQQSMHAVLQQLCCCCCCCGCRPRAHTCAARPMVAAIASASAGDSLSGSKAPMWKPVVPSFTVSTRPPVEETTGTVPYCIACSWMRPQGSKLRAGTRQAAAGDADAAAGEGEGEGGGGQAGVSGARCASVPTGARWAASSSEAAGSLCSGGRAASHREGTRMKSAPAVIM